MSNYGLKFVTWTVGTRTGASNQHGTPLWEAKLKVIVDQAPSRGQYPPWSYYYTVTVVDWFTIEGLDKLRPSNLYEKDRLAGWNVTGWGNHLKENGNEENKGETLHFKKGSIPISNLMTH
mmetsp:Transcript_23950/g.50093  ORF Transcript_23950/g.50093 Transcript_23950/m.50093 type:complete len:120 (-) Transcript_23950:68-427(-)